VDDEPEEEEEEDEDEEDDEEEEDEEEDEEESDSSPELSLTKGFFKEGKIAGCFRTPRPGMNNRLRFFVSKSLSVSIRIKGSLKHTFNPNKVQIHRDLLYLLRMRELHTDQIPIPYSAEWAVVEQLKALQKKRQVLATQPTLLERLDAPAE
jgi:hypothetical protein